MKNCKLYFYTIITSLFLLTNLIAQNNKVNKAPKLIVWIGGNYFYDATESKIPSSTFTLGFARFVAKGNVSDKISYHLMTDLAGFADASAGLSTRRSILMQAWVSYDVNKYAQFRVGQYKYPFGIETYSPITTWKFILPSYATLGITKKLGTEGGMFRDIGAQFSGKISANNNISLFYKAMIMNGNGANLLDNNNEKDIVANIGVNLPFNITVAGSYFTGKTYDANRDGIKESAFSGNIVLKQKRFTIQGEYISETLEFANKSIKPYGYYLFGTYRVIDKLELGLRYDAYDRDSEVDNNSRDRITIQTGYYFSKLNRIMVNYEIRNDDNDANLGNLLSFLFQVVL